MKESLYVGIDLGTSSLKGIVVTYDGKVIAKNSQSYKIHTPEVGWSEQNPEDWYNAFLKVMTRLIESIPKLKNNIKGIAISGQMHSLVMLDNTGKVLRNAILWNDVRNSKQSELLNTNYLELLKSETGNRSFEGLTLPKILWIKENEPDNYKNIKSILLPKDYLIYKLTGQRVMDYSDASGTMLLNINNKTWSSKILETFEIERSILPRLVSSYEKVGEMSSELKEYFGFKVPINIYGGGADNACSALGAGVTDNKKIIVSVGTSGVVLGMGKSNLDDRLHHFLHINGEMYNMGVTLSAGDSLNWIKNVIAPNESFNEVVKNEIGKKAVKPTLLFTPYLRGERCPHSDAHIRGSFIGLDMNHTRQDIIQAVMEGVIFSLRESFDLVNKQEIKQIISVGGGAKSLGWLQIQANIFQCPITTLDAEEGAALGAAMLVAVGCGDYSNFKDVINKFIKYSTRIIYPDDAQKEVYLNLYKKYINIYKATKKFFE